MIVNVEIDYNILREVLDEEFLRQGILLILIRLSSNSHLD